MKKIPLTQGKFAVIDDEDYELVSKYKWCYDGRYATANVNGTQTRMHTLLLTPQNGYEVDHINNDGCDNRRDNLRMCQHHQNLANRGLQSNNTLGYKGIVFHKHANLYQAKIQVKGVCHSGKYHKTPEEAARAYDKLARELLGEFAYQNFPNG